MPYRLTEQRRFSKDGKTILAAWLNIKFSFGNSTLYGISVENLMKFFHIRRDRAKRLLKLMWEENELFYINEEKNCIFAKSCRDKSMKKSKHGSMYSSDNVISIPVPDCYLKGKDEKTSMALEMLVRLIEEALVCREYDDRTWYKYSSGDESCVENCETEMRKTQLYVARRTGLNRTKVGRILRKYVSQGMMTRTPSHIVRCHKGDRYSFKAVNKKTRLIYYAKCEPVSFSWVNETPFIFRHLIWDAGKRRRSKLAKSKERMMREINVAAGVSLSQEDLDFKVMAKRELEMRFMYD